MTLTEALAARESNGAGVERVGHRVGERSCNWTCKRTSGIVVQAAHGQWIHPVGIKGTWASQERRRQVGRLLLLLLLQCVLMAAIERFSKAKVGRAARCVNFREKVVIAGIVVGRKQIAWQGRAARDRGDRVESVVRSNSCQTVAMLERVKWFAIVDGDMVVVDTARGGGHGRSTSSSVCSRGDDSLVVGETSTGVKVLLGHFSLEQRTLFCVDSTPIQHGDSMQGFLVSAELCESNL